MATITLQGKLMLSQADHPLLVGAVVDGENRRGQIFISQNNAKTAQDGEKNMTHDSVNINFSSNFIEIFFKILYFGTNYSHRIVHMYFFYK